MEEKNELSDIVLDNQSSNNSNKIKKILLLSIILLLIFILAIAGVKFFNKPKVKKNNFNIVLPPEPTTKNVTKKEELFKQVPIIEENSSAPKNNFYAMVEKLKNKEQNKEKSTVTNKQKNDKALKTPTTTPKQKDIKSALMKVKKHKKIVKKISSKSNVYIQVGVTFKTRPDKKYLRKITKAGYSYKLYNLKITGRKATKILIGPYKNKKIARSNLSKVKKEINKAAFIYVIK